MAQATGAGGQRDVKQIILDAAEAVFAAKGFEGATTRAIADKAGVNLALLHYHFGSKEHLYEFVLSQRAGEINATRREMLAKALSRSGGPRIEDVLDALFRPVVEYSRSAGESGKNYARIVIQLTSAADERSIRLASELFDETAREFIAAIEACFPDLGKSNAVWVYLNAATVNKSLLVQTERSQRLANGRFADAGADETIAAAIKFVAAGIRALVAKDSE